VKQDEMDFDLIDCEQLMKEKKSDEYCQSLSQLMMEIETAYNVDECGLLVRLDSKTGLTQIFIPESLSERIMTLGHYPQILGHPGGTRIYQNLRLELFWPKKAIHIHQFVQNCTSCARKRLVTQRKTSYLKLFPPSAPLELLQWIFWVLSQKRKKETSPRLLEPDAVFSIVLDPAY
jgi:hypothetical protein